MICEETNDTKKKLNPSRGGDFGGKGHEESKVKDKAVKLAGRSVMDDFGIILAGQTGLRQGGYVIIRVFYTLFTVAVSIYPAERNHSYIPTLEVWGIAGS